MSEEYSSNSSYSSKDVVIAMNYNTHDPYTSILTYDTLQRTTGPCRIILIGSLLFVCVVIIAGIAAFLIIRS